MTPEDSLSLRSSEALLDFVTTSYPELASPYDVEDDFNFPDPSIEETTTGVNPINPLLRGVNFIAEEIRFERYLTEGREIVDTPLDYRLVFSMDDSTHVICKAGAVIHEKDGGTVVIELDAPTVHGLVSSCRERPTTDLVRLTAFLVRLGCKTIGGNSGTIGFLRESVRLLRKFVSSMRQEQGDDTDDCSDNANDTTNNSPH